MIVQQKKAFFCLQEIMFHLRVGAVQGRAGGQAVDHWQQGSQADMEAVESSKVSDVPASSKTVKQMWKK